MGQHNKAAQKVTLIDWIRSVPNILTSYSFINAWSHKYNLPLLRKFRVFQSVFTALILQEVFTRELMEKYFASGALQRVWDDLYDNDVLTPEELREVRSTVIYGTESNLEISGKLRRVFLDITKGTSDSDLSYKQELYKIFVDELNLLIDGYEFEAKVKKKQKKDLIKDDELEYLKAASNSIALRYVCIVTAFSLVKNNSDLEDLKKADQISHLCAETIRLANDIGGYEEDVKEGKLSSITIRMNVEQESFEQSRDYYLAKIKGNLSTINRKFKGMQNNVFARILVKITFLAVDRYLNKTMY